VTIRRLLVFGVCALGVAALYASPSLSRSAGSEADPRPLDGTAPSSPPATRVTEAAEAPTSPRRPAASPPAAAESTTIGEAAADPTATAGPHPGATAFDPAHHVDQVAPAPVEGIVTARVTQERLSLSWPAASDNVGVVGYSVWLNGYEVASTAETRATVRWFNDGLQDNVVQVRAVDAAGNESPSSPNLLVARPTPEPVPASTSPSPSPTAEPLTGTPQPAEPMPSAQSGGGPSPGQPLTDGGTPAPPDASAAAGAR